MNDFMVVEFEYGYKIYIPRAMVQKWLDLSAHCHLVYATSEYDNGWNKQKDFACTILPKMEMSKIPELYDTREEMTKAIEAWKETVNEPKEEEESTEG